MQFVKVLIIGAFSQNQTGGSPTAVVLDPGSLSPARMLKVAEKAGTSHTAFVFEPAEDTQPIELRFFTPACEIMNCGHGTIAAHYARLIRFGFSGAKSFLQKAGNKIQEIDFQVNGDQTIIFLRQNRIQFSPVAPEIVQKLCDILSIASGSLSDQLLPILASPGAGRFLLCLNDSSLLDKINADLNSLKEICKENRSMGCFVYAKENSSMSLFSARMFCPAIGIDEDIINGNSSGCLGEYLLKLSGDRENEILVKQGKGFNRPGVVIVRSKKINDHYESSIGGEAVLEGELMIRLDQGDF
ncbi:MAG: PhzF family phenazine biosynthesis protein [Chitinophagales bacterium]